MTISNPDMLLYALAAICFFIGWIKFMFNPASWIYKADWLCGGLFFMALSLIF